MDTLQKFTWYLFCATLAMPEYFWFFVFLFCLMCFGTAWWLNDYHEKRNRRRR